MSNEHVINGNKFDINELMSLVNTEQYDKLEEAWLGIVESNNKDIQSLFDVVDLLIKREERKRAHEFLMMLVPYYKKKGLYQEVLRVLKRVLECNPKEKDWQMRLLSVIQIFIKIDPMQRNWSKRPV